VHPDQRCVELAVRRRAFARALRVPGPVDPAPVSAYVQQHEQHLAPADPAGHPPAEPRRR